LKTSVTHFVYQFISSSFDDSTVMTKLHSGSSCQRPLFNSNTLKTAFS